MNNLPIIKEESFFERIKNFFKRLFRRQKYEIVEEKQTATIEHNKKDNTIDELRIERNRKESIDYILDQIDKNEDIIFNLSDKRLDQLIRLYDDEIQRIDERIKEINLKIGLLEN